MDIDEDARIVAPWLVWLIWKNRNSLLFEGKSFPPNKTVEKAYDDTRQWSNAQRRRDGDMTANTDIQQGWVKPAMGRLKCNIGFAWSQAKTNSGAAWVLRDSTGSVLLHSRRSYAEVLSCFDAKIKSWEWALESMRSLHQRNVTFAASSMEVIKALHKPQEWPAFRGQIATLLKMTLNQEDWDICFENPQGNRGATKIAQSVISDFRVHSYVETGGPRWLRGLFDDEGANTVM